MTARVTSKRIGAAIYEKYGIVGIRLHGSGNIGCFHFYSDDDHTMDNLMRWPSTTAYINGMNHLTLDQWVESFETLLVDGERWETIEDILTRWG